MARSSAARKTKTRSKTSLKTKRKTKIPSRKISSKKAAKKASFRKSKTTSKNPKPPKTLTKKPTAQIARIGVGDMAPQFTLPNQNGELVSLNQYLGKNVVLYFYPKDDTPGCTKEACSFRDHLSSIEGKDAVILGVSFDDQTSHQKFISKYGLNFQLLCDTSKQVADQYGCYVEKNLYGNISKGIERSTFVIDRNGVIAAVFRRVSVDGHTDEVLEILNALQ